MNNDKLVIGGHEFNSRFILGSGKYSLNLINILIPSLNDSNYILYELTKIDIKLFIHCSK